MAKVFELKANLPIATRQEIDRIQAKASGVRTTAEAALLTSLTPYLTNEVILRNDANEIVIAAGETVPDEYEGFAKGALFIKSNAADAIVNQVLFGADSAAALDNLKLAINAGAGEGTNYSTGTTEHATVTATTNSNTEQTVEAKVKGTAAESIATTDTITNGDWGAATLENGVDGTVGAAKKILADSSYLYIAVAANTVADTNWRRVSLGSAY